jgi:effector-binding domain-containing protein
MDDIEKKIGILSRDYQSEHTEYQIRNFIIGSEVHPWHQYKQCLREIAKRYENLKIKKDSLKAINSGDSKLKGRRVFFRKKQKNNISKINAMRSRLLKSISEINRELKHFVNIAMEIRHKHGFEELSDERKKYLEAEAWREKAKYMLCMDLFCIGQPSKQTMEFVYKLPKDVKRGLIGQLAKIKREEVKQYLIDV